MTLSNQLLMAKTAYHSGNLTQALKMTSEILALHVDKKALNTADQAALLEILDVVTLHQSLLTITNRPHEYLSYEPLVKELTTLIFGADADFYYAIHAFDSCEAMAMHSFITEAKYYKNIALTLLRTRYGTCDYIDFMEAICTAQIAFYIEDYYTCIDAATTANALWFPTGDEQVSIPDCPNETAASRIIERVGINNLLLRCNAYGKINHPKESITLLENLLTQQVFDAEQIMFAEITLLELYLIAGDNASAFPLYEKYKKTRFTEYPGLAAALCSMAYILDDRSAYFKQKLESASYCYSKNMFTISHYNYGLALAAGGSYEEAMVQFLTAGKSAYSMRLALLAQTGNYNQIADLQPEVNQYFYRQIEQIIGHYDEALAYNHLAKLQYHIDLTLGAYCLGKLPTEKAYDFLLNTKYIALETSYLLRTDTERKLYSASDIMQTLYANTLLLEYTTLRTIDAVFYGVFIVSAQQINFVKLDEASYIDNLLQKWHRLLQASVHAIGTEVEMIRANRQDIDIKLKKALYLPIKSMLPADAKLLIAPAGSMVNFPFAELSISATGVLGDIYTITYLNTGKELLCRHTSIAPFTVDSCNALVVGNPQFSQFPNLAFAETEADMVAHFLHTTAYKKNDANLANVLDALADSPDIVHFATHGIYTAPDNSSKNMDWDALYHTMNESGIVLSDDTLLSCAHISTLDLNNTKLAVLSCCHSGQATYLGTEGAYGLRRALTLAGCDTILLSLWQVDDTAAFLFMKAFYEALAVTGASATEAFSYAHDVLKNYETDGIRPYDNPYYRAGFILVSPH